MTHPVLTALGLTGTESGTYLGNGEWARTADAGILEPINPTDGEVLARVQASSKDDYETILERAQAAFKVWRTTPAPRQHFAIGRVDRLEDAGIGGPGPFAIAEVGAGFGAGQAEGGEDGMGHRGTTPWDCAARGGCADEGGAETGKEKHAGETGPWGHCTSPSHSSTHSCSVATPTRFERVTFPLGGGCSIQLSYGAMAGTDPVSPGIFAWGRCRGPIGPAIKAPGGWSDGIPTASIRQPGVAAGAHDPNRSWRCQASRLMGIALVDPSYGAAGSTKGGRRNA